MRERKIETVMLLQIALKYFKYLLTFHFNDPQKYYFGFCFFVFLNKGDYANLFLQTFETLPLLSVGKV